MICCLEQILVLELSKPQVASCKNILVQAAAVCEYGAWKFIFSSAFSVAVTFNLVPSVLQ